MSKFQLLYHTSFTSEFNEQSSKGEKDMPTKKATSLSKVGRECLQNNYK